MFKLFDAVVCGDDVRVKNGKPSPDIFLVAASDLKSLNYKECLVFEDSWSGVQAALNSNMNVNIFYIDLIYRFVGYLIKTISKM